MPTIYDIAKAAGVSTATVSRVLNNSPQVTGKTRERVMRVMQEAQYSPNAFAQGLGLNSMRSVGILCTDASDPFFSSVIHHLEERLRHAGYHCILACTGSVPEERAACLSMLLSKHVDALMVLGSTFMQGQPEQVDYLLQGAQRVPMVFVNGYLEHPNIYCVQNDPLESVQKATAALLAAGCRNPLFLYQRPSPYTRLKHQGFVHALQACGLEERTLECPQGIAEATAFLLAHPPGDTDCVIAAHDEAAIAFLKYARRIGLRLPEDCAIVGHGDLLLAQCCEPELTSIHTDIPRLCSTAVALLMALFRGETPPKNTVIAGTVVPRGTTSSEVHFTL